MTPDTNPELEAKIEKAELAGWTVAERKNHVAVLKKRSLGSLKVHLLLLLVTLGIGNVFYAAYRLLRPKRRVVEAEPRRAETRQHRRKMQEEQAKNAREVMRTVRKFL